MSLSQKIRAEYNKRFNYWDLNRLLESEVIPEVADAYDSRFSGDDISRLFSHGVFPSKANRYRRHFKNPNRHIQVVSEIISLFESGISPAKLGQYRKAGFYSAKDITSLFNLGVSPSQAKLYNDMKKKKWGKQFPMHERAYPLYRDFWGNDIAHLVRAKISPEKAAGYDPVITGYQIVALSKSGISQKMLNKYLDAFGVIRNYSHMGLFYFKTENDISIVRAQEIAVLHRIGFSPEFIRGLPNKDVVSIIGDMGRGLSGVLEDGCPEDFKIIGTGLDSVILLKGNHAVKVSKKEKIDLEYALLKKVGDANNNSQQHVVRAVRQLNDDIIRHIGRIDLEYLEGDSLSDLLESKKVLPAQEAIQYSSGVCDGIVELRKAGIYHRDLHPGNIFIRKTGEAVIIDLGRASTDPDDLFHANRQYGGNNDLVSLGQLMYKMATGSNLFRWQIGTSRSKKDEIKTERARVYETQSLKAKYLEKVRSNVKDPRIADLIVNLLDDDLWTQPSMKRIYQMQEMFRRYKK